MRIGFFGGTEEQRVAPTFVLIPVRPSTQAIDVGQPPGPTTTLVAGMSIFSLVNGGPPVGKSPSSITSCLTFLATSARPGSELPWPGPERRRPAKLVSPPRATTVTLRFGWAASR